MVFMAAPKGYEELAEAFKKQNLSGWSLGSAEAGYVTFSKKEWDDMAALAKSSASKSSESQAAPQVASSSAD